MEQLLKSEGRIRRPRGGRFQHAEYYAAFLLISAGNMFVVGLTVRQQFRIGLANRLGQAEGLFQQVRGPRESIGLGNCLLELTCVAPVDRIL